MNFNLITKTELFRGISETETKDIIQCLNAHTKIYKKGEIIYSYGQQADFMGIVLSGSINIENDDIWGNKNIIDNIGPGQVFAETYACIQGELMMVNVVVSEPSEVLFLNVSKILKTCPNACNYHNRLIRNLVSVTAQKNLNLTRKIFHTSPKSIRGKLLSYLSFQAMSQGKRQFEIPFNRQQLADYLGVDRSAMSNELSKMQQEGIISFKKNKFLLKE